MARAEGENITETEITEENTAESVEKELADIPAEE